VTLWENVRSILAAGTQLLLPLKPPSQWLLRHIHGPTQQGHRSRSMHITSNENDKECSISPLQHTNQLDFLCVPQRWPIPIHKPYQPGRQDTQVYPPTPLNSCVLGPKQVQTPFVSVDSCPGTYTFSRPIARRASIRLQSRSILSTQKGAWTKLHATKISSFHDSKNWCKLILFIDAENLASTMRYFGALMVWQWRWPHVPSSNWGKICISYR